MCTADQPSLLRAHAWKEKTLREPSFRVVWGVERVCSNCQHKQYSDFTAGRTGGNWVESVVGPDGEPKLDATIDAFSECTPVK